MQIVLNYAATKTFLNKISMIIWKGQVENHLLVGPGIPGYIIARDKQKNQCDLQTLDHRVYLIKNISSLQVSA